MNSDDKAIVRVEAGEVQSAAERAANLLDVARSRASTALETAAALSELALSEEGLPDFLRSMATRRATDQIGALADDVRRFLLTHPELDSPDTRSELEEAVKAIQNRWILGGVKRETFDFARCVFMGWLAGKNALSKVLRPVIAMELVLDLEPYDLLVLESALEIESRAGVETDRDGHRHIRTQNFLSSLNNATGLGSFEAVLNSWDRLSAKRLVQRVRFYDPTHRTDHADDPDCKFSVRAPQSFVSQLGKQLLSAMKNFRPPAGKSEDPRPANR